MASTVSLRVAVVTPYYQESRALLERCIGSVRAQSVVADHFLISDGFPQAWIEQTGVRHIALGRTHGDFGNTPRGLGAQLAVSEGYQAIAFLDADNWFDGDHVERCLEAARSLTGDPLDCDYVVAQRRFVRPDGSVMVGRDQPGHVDTSCFFMLPGSFSVLPCWNLMPKSFSPIGDRVFNAVVQVRRLKHAKTPTVTVNYHHLWASSYVRRGEPVPEGAKPNVDDQAPFHWLAQQPEREQGWIERRLAGVRFRVTSSP